MRRIGASSIAVAFVLALAAARAEAQNGLWGEYYDNQDFTGTPTGRLDADITFDWGDPDDTPPAPGPDTIVPPLTANQTFSIRWSGLVQAGETGNYVFRATTDDGVRVWLDGVLIIDWWRDQAATNRDSAPISLTNGQRYAIVMEYYENWGDASAVLSWQTPTVAFAPIPTGNLINQVAAPFITPNGGTFSNSQIVTLATYTPGATIRYTITGADPDGTSPPYTGPFAVTTTTTVKAIALKTGMTTSAITTATITINPVDVIGPTLVSATPQNATTVAVVYNEPVSPLTGTYSISSGPGVSGLAAGSAPNIVILTLAAGLTAGTTYTLNVANVQDVIGNTTTSSIPFTYVPTGFSGEYFDDMDFLTLSNPRVLRTDAAINFPDFNAVGALPTGIGNETFSVRWQGYIEPLYTETYKFIATSDDGVRLYINGQLVINAWYDQSPTANWGYIALTAGQRYEFRFDYYENGGGNLAVLEWESLHQARQVIPQDRMFLQSTAPTITPNGGASTSSILVTLATTTLGGEIRYRLDANPPNNTTDPVYTGPLAIGANVTISARTFHLLLQPSTTTTAVFTFTDSTAPTLSDIRAPSSNRVFLRFSEPVNVAAASFQILDGATPLTISSATLGPDSQTVRLNTAAMTSGNMYSLIVSNVTDLASTPNTIAANTTRIFMYRDLTQPNLVSRWLFDEGTGTLVSDIATAVGNNGTLTGGASWAGGPTMFAGSFDGLNGFVDLLNDLGVTLGQGTEVTLTAWIKTTQVSEDLDANHYPGITGIEANNANNFYFGTLNPQGRLTSRTGWGATATSTNPINNDQWHHIAVTRNSTTGAIQIYVDGVAGTSVNSETGAKTALFDSLARVMCAAGAARYLRGAISDVQVYSRILTAAEIATFPNRAPTANAGPDLTAGVGVPEALTGTAADVDTLPSGTLTTTWSLVTGPGTVTFADPNALSTTATFSAPGTYQIRLAASDGSLAGGDDCIVTVSGIIVTPTSGLTTTEAGGQATFQVVLSTPPTLTVRVNVQSLNTSEGTVSPAFFDFTSGNWSIPQTFTVTGVDDAILDFGVTYTIETTVSTTDPDYAGTNPADVVVTNTDNETIPELDEVWSKCGATGAEVFLGLLLLGLWRRRFRR